MEREKEFTVLNDEGDWLHEGTISFFMVALKKEIMSEGLSLIQGLFFLPLKFGRTENSGRDIIIEET